MRPFWRGIFGTIASRAVNLPIGHLYHPPPLPPRTKPTRPTAVVTSNNSSLTRDSGSFKFLSKTISQQEFSEEGLTQIQVYEEVNRSVVNISTRPYTRDPFFMIAKTQEGAGSGSILDKEGHILTNYHVIEGAKYINVTLFDESPDVAEVVGADPKMKPPCSGSMPQRKNGAHHPTKE